MLRSAIEPGPAEDDVTMIVRKSERAYNWLRDEILSFRMQPGMFIDKIEVCDRLGVSKQPVTAALTRLEQEGLVEIYPQRGSYVARLRLGALVESLFIRGALEAAVVRRLAEGENAAVLATLLKAVEAQEAALASENMTRFYALDTEFHTTIARSAPFPQVTRQIEIGLATVRRCHDLFRPDATALAGAFTRHKAIVAAIEARDGEVAAREMSGHVTDYSAMLEVFAATRPELFVG